MTNPRSLTCHQCINHWHQSLVSVCHVPLLISATLMMISLLLENMKLFILFLFLLSPSQGASLFKGPWWLQLNQEDLHIGTLTTPRNDTFLFTQNHRDWAQFHRHDFLVFRSSSFDSSLSPSSDSPSSTSGSPSSTSPDSLQLMAMKQHLMDYDWLCWVDSETLIVDMDFDIRHVIMEASEQRPQLDLILQQHPQQTKTGDRLNRALWLVRNSPWSRQLLDQLLEMVSNNEEWVGGGGGSHAEGRLSIQAALAYLVSTDESMLAHLYVQTLVELWDSSFLYLPKTLVIGFQNCVQTDPFCLSVMEQTIQYLLTNEQTMVYRMGPFIQKMYHLFVILYLLFALDRLLHIVGLLYNRSSVVEKKKNQVTTYFQCGIYPHVAIQLPMFNESSCCQSIIDAACRLNWPLNRLLIQVVDDSTSEYTKYLIDRRVHHWKRLGIPIEVRRRTHRFGFKAGALNEATVHLPDAFRLIAIFDADFLPEPDFLRKTVPYFEDVDLAFVQTRWTYTNAKESWLTRMQEISLNFHFLCEQDVRFRFNKFFNFNGTAGVWNRTAIESVGGWHTDTLVEDTDLSLRTWAENWKFIYLKHVECLNEIPPTFGAYRGQQHRWTSGPMQVLKKAFGTILRSKISLVDKLFCFWFFLRTYVHVINFFYFLILVPLMIWIPRVTTYDWAMVYLPAAVSITNIFFTPSEWRSVIVYVLFENAMCLFKATALVSGIFNIGQANHWTVTPKFARKLQLDTAKSRTSEDSQSLLAKYSPALNGTWPCTPDQSASTDFSSEDMSPIKLPQAYFQELKSGSFESLPDLISSSSDLSVSPSPCIVAPTQLQPTAIFSAPNTTTTSLKSDAFELHIVDDDDSTHYQEPVAKVASAYSDRPNWFSIRVETIHYPELFMSLYLFGCFYFGFLMRQYGIALFCFCNACAYLVLAFSFIGRHS